MKSKNKGGFTCNGFSFADFISHTHTVQSAEADNNKLSSENQQSV